jgi:RimJ/RimL family protein N-acetyltransferase
MNTEMTELQKAFVTLRGFKETDCNQLAKLCNNRKIWDNLRDFIPSPYSEQNAVDFIKICRLENPQVTFAIHYNEELAGCIGLVLQSDIYRLSAEIGYWIGEPFWGLGIATTAVELLTEYGFEQLKLIRIYSGVFEYNLASQRVLEKAGYKKEGVFEKSIIKNGVICNEYRYAKIVGESLAVGY